MKAWSEGIVVTADPRRYYHRPTDLINWETASDTVIDFPVETGIVLQMRERQWAEIARIMDMVELQHADPRVREAWQQFVITATLCQKNPTS